MSGFSWPETDKNETLTKEEISVVRDLTFSLATYVKQKIVNSMIVIFQRNTQ